MSALERQLEASVSYVREQKRQQQPDPELAPWLDPSAHARPKSLPKKAARKMNTALATIDPGSMLERVVVHGDLSKLAPGDRAVYYGQVCNSLGLNPLTRPFEYLTLNGKQILYARRDCTDQLRKIHAVSVTIQAREHIGDLLVVTARASLPNGRTDESTGAVAVGKLQGEALANAMMKAETKAKRRVTLSICGLAVLDESELDGARATEGANGTQGPHHAHVYEGENANDPPVESAEYDALLTIVRELDVELRKKGTTYEQALECRNQVVDTKSPWAKRWGAISEQVAPVQRKELGAAWQRLKRLVVKLEQDLKPSVEASFIDEPDEFDQREPGDD